MSTSERSGIACVNSTCLVYEDPPGFCDIEIPFNLVADSRSDDADAYYESCYLGSGTPDELQAVIQQAPRAIGPRLRLGDIMLTTGDPQGAYETYSFIISDHWNEIVERNGDPFAAFSWGESLLTEGHIGDAAQILRNLVLKLQPSI